MASFTLVIGFLMLVSAHVGAFYLARYARRLTSAEGRHVAEPSGADTRGFQHTLGRIKWILALSGMLSVVLLLVLLATELPYPGLPLLVFVMICAFLSVSVLEKGTRILADRLDAIQHDGVHKTR